MTTETKAVITPTIRESIASTFTRTSDATKSITEGCGKLIVVDNTENAGDLTVTITTRADPVGGRTVDPGTYNPVTVPGGSTYYLGPYTRRLYGQGTSQIDLTLILSLGATAVATPASFAVTPSTTGGTLADATYYYRVSAIDRSGGETLAAAELSAVVAGGGGSGSVDLRWDAMVGAVGYIVYGRSTSGAVKRLWCVTADPDDAAASDKAGWLDTGAYVESATAPLGAATAADAVAHVYCDAVAPTITDIF